MPIAAWVGGVLVATVPPLGTRPSATSAQVASAALPGSAFSSVTLAPSVARLRAATVPLSEALAMLAFTDPDKATVDPEGAALSKEVLRLVGTMSPEMRLRVLGLKDGERVALARRQGCAVEEVGHTMLAATFAKSGISSLRCARYALTRLAEFGASIGVTPDSFDFSPGLISVFLSSQAAPSMPSRLLVGLKWARDHMGSLADAHSPFLAPFNVRHHGGGHATTWYVKACCKLAAVAGGAEGFEDLSSNEYLAAVASGATLMVNASLRWIDAFRAKKIADLPDAVDGYTPKTKSGPMHWWADRRDVLGSTSWLAPLLAARAATTTATGVFRKAKFGARRSGDPTAFQGWTSGPAPKAHVVRAIRYILENGPEPFPPEVSAALARLHGARRVYPSAARFLSKELGLTVDDRDELGRWKACGDAAERSKAGARPLSNLYGSDAARHRCVETRLKVGDAVRARIASVGWRNLDAS